MSSPILGPFEPLAKRAISVLDQDYDLMGLSQKNAVDESFMLEEPPLLNFNEPVYPKNESIKQPPMHESIENGLLVESDYEALLMDPQERPF